MPHDEWFTKPDAPERGTGLRFGCTMCGRCCSGPPGFVIVSEAETAALAKRLGISVTKFKNEYTNMMSEGRSLNEKKTDHGLDCIFLDRTTIPGKAICGVYEDRPTQCRTWPFWPSLVKSRRDWEAAKKSCPGMDKGELVPVERIRILRDSFKI
ncbi:MAG: YkgJ family cysteine cluster protein [Chloroflexi bacterium]|nr:YkgJ family cysteine cluster protein [Chloroflexota bacterium]